MTQFLLKARDRGGGSVIGCQHQEPEEGQLTRTQHTEAVWRLNEGALKEPIFKNEVFN